MALTTTPGASNADSYGSLSEANAYFTSHWSVVKTSAWAALSDTQKESVLKAAVKVIDTLKFHDVVYAGPMLPPALTPGDVDLLLSKYDPDQSLAFPRNIDVVSNNPFIPPGVKEAQFEQAVYLLNFDDANISNQLQGVMEEAVAASGVRVYQQFSHRGSFVAPMALEFLRVYLRRARRLHRA